MVPTGAHAASSSPANEEQPANLPLCLRLARAILSVLHDDLAPDTWLDVTSLVARDELERVFPTTHAEAARMFGVSGGWPTMIRRSPIRRGPRSVGCWA
jgi:hypothetical protein